MCRKKQHVRIDDMKEMSDLICGKAAVGGNYNSACDKMREIKEEPDYSDSSKYVSANTYPNCYL